MRILRLTQRLPPLPGGLESHARELSLAQAARGAEVEIHFAEGEPVTGPGVGSYRLAAVGEMYSLTRKWPSQQRFSTAASRVSRCAFGVPHVIHAHGDYALAAAALRLGARFGCPAILTVHGGLSERPWHRAVSRAVFPKLAHVIAVSEDVAAQLRARGVEHSRISVISSGIHRSRLQPLTPERRRAVRAGYGVGPPLPTTHSVGTRPLPYGRMRLRETGLSTEGQDGGGVDRRTSPPRPTQRGGSPRTDREVLVAAVGRLHAVKGYRHLIEAMRSLEADGRPLRLVLAGAGPEEAALREAAQGLHSVCFAGLLAPAEVAELLGAADLFVHPAVELGTQREGTPTSVLEAMAAGLPVIATRTGGLPALVRDGENGCLVPAEDPAALAGALRALAADPTVRAAQGERNRRHPACRDWEEVAERLLDLYPTLAPAGNAAPAASVSSEAAW